MDERRHPPEAGLPHWEESWDFDFTTQAGDLGGYLRLGLHPELGASWLWAALVGKGRPLVTVVDHEVPLLRGPGMDLRAEGLWADLVCETPLEHWTLGLEAFGVALADPTEAYRSGRGDRTALGFDLEWETRGPATPLAGAAGYHLPCLVHGQVLVGAEVIDFEGWGSRSHAWGSRSWWDQAWCTTAGRLEDGTTWRAEAPAPVRALADGGLPGRTRFELRDLGLQCAVDPRYHAPVRLDAADGRTSHVVRSLCRCTTADGRAGTGWAEWNSPQRSATDTEVGRRDDP